MALVYFTGVQFVLSIFFLLVCHRFKIIFHVCMGIQSVFLREKEKHKVPLSKATYDHESEQIPQIYFLD